MVTRAEVEPKLAVADAVAGAVVIVELEQVGVVVAIWTPALAQPSTRQLSLFHSTGLEERERERESQGKARSTGRTWRRAGWRMLGYLDTQASAASLFNSAKGDCKERSVRIERAGHGRARHTYLGSRRRGSF